MINKQTPDWKDKQNIQNLLNQQQNFATTIGEYPGTIEENNRDEEEFFEMSDELLAKPGIT